jgi:hypothetical protein
MSILKGDEEPLEFAKMDEGEMVIRKIRDGIFLASNVF